MLHDVTAATYQGDYRIEIEFDDGSRGIVDFAKYLTRGGVFERFKDLDLLPAVHRRCGIRNPDVGGELTSRLRPSMRGDRPRLPGVDEADDAGADDQRLRPGCLRSQAGSRS